MTSHELVEAHYNYALRVAHQALEHYPPTIRDECAPNGVFGLIEAAELFDETLGVKFTTFAFTWIQRSAKRAARNFRRCMAEPLPYEPQARPEYVDPPNPLPALDDEQVALLHDYFISKKSLEVMGEERGYSKMHMSRLMKQTLADARLALCMEEARGKRIYQQRS